LDRSNNQEVGLEAAIL